MTDTSDIVAMYFNDNELYDIPDYNGKYKITKTGKIYNSKLKRYMGFSYDQKGYNLIRLNGVTKRVHRLVGKTFLTNQNEYPVLDHINRIKTDNRLENLRYCPYWVNNLNIEAVGVYRRSSGRYYAVCRNKNLGTFDTFQEDKKVYEDYKQNILDNFENFEN